MYAFRSHGFNSLGKTWNKTHFNEMLGGKNVIRTRWFQRRADEAVVAFLERESLRECEK